MHRMGHSLDSLPPNLRARILAQIHDDTTRAKLPNTKPERDHATALGGAVEGKKEGLGRVRVRFTGCRVRPLDPDNFAGSVKNCLDFLHRSKLIEGDEPWRIILETDQIKVAHFADEKTIIEVTYP